MFLMETTGNTKKAELKWIFRNVPSLDWQNKKPGECYFESSYFHADGDEDVKWFVRLYPNGRNKDCKGNMSVFLALSHSPTHRPTIKAEYTFILLDEERKKILNHESLQNTFTVDITKRGWGCLKLAKMADVLKHGVISFTCKLEYADPNNASTKSFILPGPSAASLNNEELTSSLNQNLEQLFTNRSETDVCFVVAGMEIKGHKAIVSARSPVFSAMLKSGMKESTENRVEINDIAPDIFEALLRFIYTDRVDLNQVDAKDLLAAANKYLLPLLKFQCQQFLSQTITLGNYVELLLLADLHNAVHLKRSALNFIRLNRKVIMQSDGWKNLKQSRPDLSFVFDIVETLL